MLSLDSPQDTVKQLHTYARSKLLKDVIAGLTVATIAVPQSMAFAIVAGLSPIHGLYTAVVAVIVGALAGHASYLTTMTTNALSLVVASTFASLAIQPGDELAYLFTLTLLVGFFQLGLGWLRLGNLARFVSNAVMVGFISGAGLLIIVGQLGNLLPAANLAALALGIFTIGVIVALRHTRLALAAPLIGIIAASLAAALLNLEHMGVRMVGTMTSIPSGLPPFMPQIPVAITDIAPKALALALLGLVQTISIVQSMSVSTGEQVKASREFIGQGVANLAGAFFQCLPAGGSLSMTAVNQSAGAKTRMSGVFAGAFLAAILVIFGPLAERIPMPALAGLLIVVAAGLIERDRIKLVLRTSRQSMAVFLVTFAATLIFPLEYSIYLGAMLSIGIYLQESSQPHVERLVPSEATFRSIKMPEEVPRGQPILINVSGNLHFAAIQAIKKQLPDIEQVEHPIIILRLRGDEYLGTTGITFLEGLLSVVHDHNGALILCGVESSVAKRLAQSGLLDKLGTTNVFEANTRLLDSTHQAMARAKEIQRRYHRSNNRN